MSTDVFAAACGGAQLVAPDAAAQNRRARRWQLARWRRRAARSICRETGAVTWNTVKGATSCGRPLPERDDVRVGFTRSGDPHVDGIMRCASAWACPICGPNIRAQRGKEIDLAVAVWQAMGGHVWFVTLTTEHVAGDSLKAAWRRTASMWSTVWSGRSSMRLREELAIAGSIRVFEVTYGRNGWHVHVHALMFSELRATKQVARELGGQCRKAYQGAGLRYIPRVSLDVRGACSCCGRSDGATVGDYMGGADGWGVGLELARADLKRGRGLSHMQVLELASTGERQWCERWFEFEQESKGEWFIRWSKGLRDLLGVETISDEEAAAVDVDDEIVFEFGITRTVWNRWFEGLGVGELLERLWSGELPEGCWRCVGPPPDG